MKPFEIALFALIFASSAIAREQPLSREDLLWLDRVTYGLSAQTLADYQKLGRRRFLADQLAPNEATLPDAVRKQIAVMEIERAEPRRLLADLNADNQRINAMPEGQAKNDARKTINDHGNQLTYQAMRRDVLRAIYSPAQLQEQLTWFWLNHFSVFQYKAALHWLIPDYEEQAIRPHVLGKFRDLVMATLKHPAMLQYLDNAQNAAGHINENYARELMELHTLGVSSGYTQQDVQELARILTGVGLNAADKPPVLKLEWKSLYRREGAFEFNPARHDFGKKRLLSVDIEPGGFDEVERAVDLLVHQPACARFVSQKLATYFVADTPPAKLIEQMTKIFERTDGDIAKVLQTMFSSSEFSKSLGHRFKDPMHFVVSSMRLAYGDKVIVNTHPIVNWLNALGELPYGHISPDGYPMTEAGWSSSGQMSKRFEIARALASGNAGLFEPEDGTGTKGTGFPFLSTKLYFEQVEPALSAQTRNALDQANSQQEWNTFLLAAPEFNYY